MHQHLPRKVLTLLSVLLLTVCITEGWTQTFKNGIRQGIVKVKFTDAMTETVSKMQVTFRSDGVSTGIQKFDVAAKSVHASNMYRLFPYDAKHENKLRKHGLHLWYIVEIDENVDPRTAVLQFKQLPEVASAEVEREKVIAPYQVVDYLPGAAPLSVLPFNDPYLKDQWHYENAGQSGFGDADVNLFKAWETTSGTNNIIVSVHDEGVDVKHEDLKSNLWINADEIVNNGIDDDNNGYIDDINGYNFSKNKGAIDAQYHGTHVAGTIAAVNNNGKGVCGVAGGDGSGNGVKIMSLEILGGGLIERSYVYAANNGAVISQNSWGYGTDSYFDQSVLDAIKYFIAEAGNYEGSPMRGGIVIFAAGNSNHDGYWYPARYEPILSVGAIGPEWKKAAYSNYGSWVDIAAPGGDQINYPGINGVLSTIPDNKYAYLQGTSMACPHVSGVAALVLANRTKQFTAAELWNKLTTGVVSIDAQNEEFIGKLGSGAIDASLAIKIDEKIAPETITDLNVDGVSQEFATLSWTVPSDGDDDRPASFTLYYHTQPIAGTNLLAVKKVTVKNNLYAGTKMNFEVPGLLGFTTYYFAVTSTDRWGNVSQLSNIPSSSTNDGPSISVEPASIEIEIDASVASSKATSLVIENGAAGILRWESFMRQRLSTSTFNVSDIHYPVAINTSSVSANIGRTSIKRVDLVKKEKAEASSFDPVVKSFSTFPTDIIGETDTSIPNSAAGRFYVSEEGGFNLTDVGMYLKHDPKKGPVVVEIFEGSAPTKDNLVYAQEYVSYMEDETWASIILDEQLYFEKGSTFWVAFHIPTGNLFPLGIGPENEPQSSTNCFMSFNVGATWQPLEEALNDKGFAWVMSAGSYNQTLGTYLSLDPSNGDLAGNSETTITLTADASTLVNGNYSANLVLASNDMVQRELRIPVNIVVNGHVPDIQHVDIADFGPVFIGESKTLDIQLDNQGYGTLDEISFDVNGADFIIESSPYSISAREQAVLRVVFNPSSSGNKNAILTLSNNAHSYSISLFGVSAETSKISIDPETQRVDNLTIGEPVTAEITVENTGAFPLKYFIPGFDSKGISENWPSNYHRYGYKVRSNNASEPTPIAYEFQDISTTGVDITSQLMRDDVYVDVDMGFSFPYYGKTMHKIYIAQKGFTTFDNSVRPVNTPTLNNSTNPGGYISLLGTWLTYISEGKIYYKVEADHLIIQYDHVTDGNAHLTAQMVLRSNGDIRFYYEDMGFDEFAQSYLNILMEDVEKSDGILIHNYEHAVPLSSGLALGFDYPGPDIITSVNNGSGILAPGTSALVEISLNTTSLSEGMVNRYINFISNDPSSKQRIALVQLNITDGGAAQPELSTNEVSFGNVFQGSTRSEVFTIKNAGTAIAEITSIHLDNGLFSLSDETPTTINPGLNKRYTITIPTNSIGNRTDVLTIMYADGNTQTISISGNVIEPPAIVVDLSTISETLNYGEKKSYAITIENTGAANLDFSTFGKPWLSFESNASPSATTYSVQKENSGGIYQWLDIRKTGVQLPFATDPDDENQYWRNLTLPFAFEYFGESYVQLNVGENGVISFEESPLVMQFSDSIPSSINEGAFIMPYWAFAGFNTTDYKPEDVGIFYQYFADKIVITWSHLVNRFGGMGDPVSAQLILYNNGMMRFQYRVEGNGMDLTSTSTFVGLQQNSSNGILISDRLALDHGKGLAFNVLPVKNFLIEPNNTLSGQIILDASNTYTGNYISSLTMLTNVPGSEVLEKPVSLTINGTAELSAPSTVDFGEKIVAFENELPVFYTEEIEISNSGTTPVDISWIESASGGSQPLSLQLYVLIDGWIGPSWEWVDISQIFSPWNSTTPVYQIMPGNQMKVRAIFYPSGVGDYTDEVVLTASIGETRIALQGTGIEAPSLEINDEAINVALSQFDESSTQAIAFNNLNGKSNLDYSVKIEFDRVIATRVNEAVTDGALNSSSLKWVDASSQSGIETQSVYNRILKHTERENPDTHVGTGGSGPFTIATRFNAGNKGFNLSHVETWFRAESFAEGIVELEVRAGGNSITESATLIQSSVQFSRSGDDTKGNWLPLPLDHPTLIYPNEDFYVIVTYPFGINYPQGLVKNEPTAPGRYLVSENGIWTDIQNEDGFLTTGWLMYAAELTEQTSSWIDITSATEGSLEPGQESSINLAIDGELASRGDQIANVVITTNDPLNKVVSIPVTLHMNEAPKFGEIPDQVLVGENDTVTVKVNVTDIENNVFVVRPDQAYEHVSSNLENGILSITMTPAFGSQGDYQFTFIAVDEYNAKNSITLRVEVEHTNQSPVFIGSDETISLSPTGQLYEFNIGDYFEDPDGDAFTFTIASSNTELLEVFASSDKFLLKPKKAGELNLAFTVVDTNSGVTLKAISTVVNVILAADESLLSNGLRLYPNPADNVITVEFGDQWRGEKVIEIMDVKGVIREKTGTNLGVSVIDVTHLSKGIYILRASSSDKSSITKFIVK